MLNRLRIALRGGVYWYKRFIANKLYGAHLDKTVRLSSSTVIDKNNSKGIYIGEYTYLAGGQLFLLMIIAALYTRKRTLARSVL